MHCVCRPEAGDAAAAGADAGADPFLRRQANGRASTAVAATTHSGRSLRVVEAVLIPGFARQRSQGSPR